MNEPYNAAERLHVRRAAKAARVADGLDEGVVRSVMSDPVGRGWMYRRLERCHIFKTSHTGNALNTAFAEGERNIGLMFLDDIMRACPQQYTQMMEEENVRRTANDRDRSRRNPADDGRDLGGPEPDDDPDEAA